MIKNAFYFILLLSTTCLAQIDKTNIRFEYIKYGHLGDQIKVEFIVADFDSVVVNKTTESVDFKSIENETITVNDTIDKKFKIEKTQFELLCNELEAAIELEPEQEEYICSSGNYLKIYYKINGESKKISSSCIALDMNSWSYKLLQKFLEIIDEKKM
jgi:hypothetical protein